MLVDETPCWAAAQKVILSMARTRRSSYKLMIGTGRAPKANGRPMEDILVPDKFVTFTKCFCHEEDLKRCKLLIEGVMKNRGGLPAAREASQSSLGSFNDCRTTTSRCSRNAARSFPFVRHPYHWDWDPAGPPSRMCVTFCQPVTKCMAVHHFSPDSSPSHKILAHTSEGNCGKVTHKVLRPMKHEAPIEGQHLLLIVRQSHDDEATNLLYWNSYPGIGHVSWFVQEDLTCVGVRFLGNSNNAAHNVGRSESSLC
jgi:hypothetical protein